VKSVEPNLAETERDKGNGITIAVQHTRKERRGVERPTRQQVKKVCVICLKLATGDYFGAVQDLSLSNVPFDRLLRLTWVRG
jgi:hypothetical protein